MNKSLFLSQLESVPKGHKGDGSFKERRTISMTLEHGKSLINR